MSRLRRHWPHRDPRSTAPSSSLAKAAEVFTGVRSGSWRSSWRGARADPSVAQEIGRGRCSGAGRRNERRRRRRVIRWSKASPTRRLLRHRSFPMLLVAIQTVVDCELGWTPFIATAVACDRTGFGVQFLSGVRRRGAHDAKVAGGRAGGGNVCLGSTGRLVASTGSVSVCQPPRAVKKTPTCSLSLCQ
jgi:hypothetical protein